MTIAVPEGYSGCVAAYRTPARAAEHQDEVKGSRFLATVAPIAGPAEAEALVAARRAQHPGASHHCWAYRVGGEQRFSDDGEPGGTAGRPMLEVLLKRDLDHVAAVVVRYFGGRKLGAGGLARAYGAAVARALDGAGERTVEPTLALTVRAPFAYTGAVLHELDSLHGLTRQDPAYEPDGVRLSVRAPESALPALQRRLADLTKGEARLELSGDSLADPRGGAP